MTGVLWHSVAGPPPGPKTHALIIATSHYAYLPADGTPGVHRLTQLDSAALGAHKLAIWLRANGARLNPPLATIRLLMSPSNSEAQRISSATGESEWTPTIGDNVQSALLEWQKECQDQPGNLALLYVAGHGLLVSPDSPVVLVHDALKFPNLTSSIDIASIQAALGLGRIGSSLIFVDACQQIPADSGLSFKGDITLAPPNNPQPESRMTRPIYYGAAPARMSYGDIEQGSYLSQGLIACLEGRAAVHADNDWDYWTITSTSLAEALPAAVAAISANQTAETAGVNRRHEILHFAKPPELPITLRVLPEEYNERVEGRLLDRLGHEIDTLEVKFGGELTLACGKYTLRIDSRRPPTFPSKYVPIVQTPPTGSIESVVMP